jgi:hypothetical protein
LKGVAGREDLDRSQHAYVVSLARIEALFRIESEGLELVAPFSRRIAEPLDADATGQATFNRCLDNAGREEGERDRHVDLPDAALGSACNFRFRRKIGKKWERFTIDAEPRSLYILTGEYRHLWEHSIPPVEEPRYSITLSLDGQVICTELRFHFLP